MRFMKKWYILKESRSRAAFDSAGSQVHFSFENETKNEVAVNSERYQNMLNQLFCHQLENIDLDELRFY